MEGRDKLFVEFAGERLLARIERQLRSRFDDLVVVSSRQEAFAGLGYRVVPDTLLDGGPLAGLHAGLRAARSEWVYLVACDMPFFSAVWVDTLRRAIDGAETASRLPGQAPVAAAARSGPFFEPFHAFYNHVLIDDIQTVLVPSRGDARRPSIQSVVGRRNSLLLDSAPDTEGESLFVNINTPEDLTRAFDMMESRAHTSRSIERDPDPRLDP